MRRDNSQDFVPNNCQLEETQRLWLLTGPNMAGKSTFLRQNALIGRAALLHSLHEIMTTNPHRHLSESAFTSYWSER